MGGGGGGLLYVGGIINGTLYNTTFVSLDLNFSYTVSYSSPSTKTEVYFKLYISERIR